MEHSPGSTGSPSKLDLPSITIDSIQKISTKGEIHLHQQSSLQHLKDTPNIDNRQQHRHLSVLKRALHSEEDSLGDTDKLNIP